MEREWWQPHNITEEKSIDDTQFTTSTVKKKTYCMHDMHKLSVDMTFIYMMFKKGTKNHGERVVAAIYN